MLKARERIETKLNDLKTTKSIQFVLERVSNLVFSTGILFNSKILYCSEEDNL